MWWCIERWFRNLTKLNAKFRWLLMIVWASSLHRAAIDMHTYIIAMYEELSMKQLMTNRSTPLPLYFAHTSMIRWDAICFCDGNQENSREKRTDETRKIKTIFEEKKTLLRLRNRRTIETYMASDCAHLRLSYQRSLSFNRVGRHIFTYCAIFIWFNHVENRCFFFISCQTLLAISLFIYIQNIRMLWTNGINWLTERCARKSLVQRSLFESDFHKGNIENWIRILLVCSLPFSGANKPMNKYDLCQT